MPFGHATSHGPLSFPTDAFILYICRAFTLDGGLFEDDLLMGRKMVWHGDCMGLKGGCETCVTGLPGAEASEKVTCHLLDELHLTRSEKRNGVAQDNEFIGVICDTFLGRFVLTVLPTEKLMAKFE